MVRGGVTARITLLMCSQVHTRAISRFWNICIINYYSWVVSSSLVIRLAYLSRVSRVLTGTEVNRGIRNLSNRLGGRSFSLIASSIRILAF